MGGGGSKPPTAPTKRLGDLITTANVFGRSRSILTIMIMTGVILAIGAMILKMAGQGGPTGAMGCMVFFGLLLAFSVYFFYNIDGQVVIITTYKPGLFGEKKEEKDNEGEIYWSFEFAISGMVAFFLLVFISFTQLNKFSSAGPRRNGPTRYWRS